MKFTDGERIEIMARARATVAAVKEDMRRWAEEDRRRRATNGFVTKTIENARVAEPEPAPAPGDVDRIDAGIRSVLEIAGEAHGHLERDVREGFRKRDREIEALRREIKTLRDEVGLERGLAKLKAEINQARQQAPSFKAELNALQEKMARQEKTILKLRVENSQLTYGQSQLEKQQRQSQQHLKVTSLEISNVGAATRAVLEGLQREGFEWTQ